MLRATVFKPAKPDGFYVGANSDAVDDFGAVLRRIDVKAEGTLAEGGVDDRHVGLGNRSDIGIRGFERGEASEAVG